MKPWIDYIVRTLNAPILTREEFVARFFPQYVKEWRPNYAIKLRPDGRCKRMPTRGDARAQQTKRDNKINAAFSEYQNLTNSKPTEISAL